METCTQEGILVLQMAESVVRALYGKGTSLNLTSKKIKEVPQCVSRLTNLSVLLLNNNSITALPCELLSLKQVSLLRLFSPRAHLFAGTFPRQLLKCVTQHADLWLNIFLYAMPASWLSWIWGIIPWRSSPLFWAIWSPWRSSICSATKLQSCHLRWWVGSHCSASWLASWKIWEKKAKIRPFIAIYVLQVAYKTLLCSIWTITKFKDFHQRLKGIWHHGTHLQTCHCRFCSRPLI